MQYAEATEGSGRGGNSQYHKGCSVSISYTTILTRTREWLFSHFPRYEVNTVKTRPLLQVSNELDMDFSKKGMELRKCKK